MPERKYFENWQSRVFNPDTWEANYYSSYIGTIALHQLDKHDNQRFSIYVKEAYPKTVAAQTFSQGNNNAYQTLSVNFTFRSYDSSASSMSGLFGLSGLVGHLSTLGGVVGAAAGLAQNVGQAADLVSSVRSNLGPFI